MPRRSPFIAAAVLLSALPARAATIDFESAPASPVASYTEAGVTFTPVSAAAASLFVYPANDPGPNGTRTLTAFNSGGFVPIRARFASPVTSVSVDLGDFPTFDPDRLFLEAYSAADVLLASFTVDIDIDDVMQTLTVSAPGIAYAVFGSSALSDNGSSVHADNFTFSAAAAPLPTTALAAAPLLLTFAARRRREHAAA